MEIRKNPEMPKLTRPVVPQEGAESLEGIGGHAKAIGPGGCFPSPGLERPLDLDRFSFNVRDKNKDGALTSDEYGVGKKKQDEFRRYDRNNDGKVEYKEFKLGRFLDRLKDRWPGGIEIKPVPMPVPTFPGGDLKPVPMPIPKFPEGEIKPMPMPNPKIDGSILLAGAQSVSDLVSKVKQAQEGPSPDEK